ncbi:MAG: CPBP family intramembrane metalloprotease [Methanophagales archaeon]|nr:CPBP family intramembrane metalloprotease [Methanophagales archaeon]
MYPLIIGAIQIIPAIILIVYGLVKQKRFQVYFDMLLMALPATLFYGIFMRILPEGLFEWYFYFFAKAILFLLPGLIIIRLRKYKLRDFGITKERLRLSLLLGFGILIITTLTNAIIFIQNPEMTLAWSSQFVSPSNLIMIWSIPLFFDAFNEEFLFRGIFFFFAYKNTENLPLAYIVSMMVAFAWHPLTPFRMVPVFIQGTLLCYLLYKSKNIHGAWICHGINRTSSSVVAQLLMG